MGSDLQRTITGRQGVGMTAKIVQHNELTFARVVIDHDIVIVIRHGSKTIRWGNCEATLHAGDAVAIAGGRTVDITNRLGEDGSYEAVWLVWDRDLVVAHNKQHAGGLQPVGDIWPIKHGDDGFLGAFEDAVASLSDLQIPQTVARHRLAEVLVWMEVHGVRFQPADAEPLTARVRQMLASELDRDWTAPLVARKLAMSEATLRRRLASESMSLSELLIDVRMSSALTLLQSTDRPISQISLEVGYESPSRFAVRFRERFGFAPTSIRGHRRDEL
jgi:AraC-like DNA-binding protein